MVSLSALSHFCATFPIHFPAPFSILNDILKFQKILKQIPDVDIDMIYIREKFGLEIPNIFGCTKMINSDRL
jgi:hypothetical protein